MKSRKPPPVVSAAIAIIKRDGRYLVSQRPRRAHLGGYWEFPGGKRQAGETWYACLRRELREELGVSARITRRLGFIRYAYPDRSVRLAIFSCTIGTDAPRPLGSSRIRWVTPAQLRRLRWPAANATLVRWLTHESPPTAQDML